MKAIHKMVVPIEDQFILDLPRDSKILSLQVQYGTPVLWYECDPNSVEYIARTFRTITTGRDIEDNLFNDLNYIGTYIIAEDRFVGHLYEEIS